MSKDTVQEQFQNEKHIYPIDGSTVFSSSYIAWLEKQIEQLKAENERLKRGVLEKVELLIKHPKFDDVLYYEGYLPEIALQIKEALNKE